MCHDLLAEEYLQEVHMSIECFIHSHYLSGEIEWVDINSVTGKNIPYFILEYLLDNHLVMGTFDTIYDDSPIPLDEWLDVNLKFYCDYSNIYDIVLSSYAILTPCDDLTSTDTEIKI